MKKRIFIAINFGEKIKNNLVEIQKEIERNFYYSFDFSPIKMTKKENLHCTLLFIGDIEDSELIEIFDITEKAIAGLDNFDLQIKDVNYGPNQNNPKMVWANLEKTSELTKLQTNIERAILNNGYNAEIDKKYTPHITLGRIIQWQFKKINPEDIPNIEKDLGFGFSIKSIEIMESFMKKGGSEYCILKSFPLENEIEDENRNI
ncbi:MAG: RNA 2',3'-cyclic phosphodiesterase [Candidatus Pacebacteria bacterium]|nr:RNA 2',3'-cyclic phosphodiesterase [Candidatus Paceibacterota bacterium]